MSKTFRYTKFTKYHYCDYSDEWEEDGVEFDYEVEDKDLLPVIVNLLVDDYFSDDNDVMHNEDLRKSVKENLKKLIDEQDMVSILADNYEDTLKEIFREEAMEFYED